MAERDALVDDEALDLVKMTLGHGAWRTIRGHFYIGLRLEYFIRTLGTDEETVFPVKSASVVKYLMYLRGRVMKPFVSGAVRAACVWVSRSAS